MYDVEQAFSLYPESLWALPGNGAGVRAGAASLGALGVHQSGVQTRANRAEVRTRLPLPRKLHKSRRATVHSRWILRTGQGKLHWLAPAVATRVGGSLQVEGIERLGVDACMLLTPDQLRTVLERRMVEMPGIAPVFNPPAGSIGRHKPSYQAG